MMARQPEPHEYDGSEDSADRADFRAFAAEVDDTPLYTPTQAQRDEWARMAEEQAEFEQLFPRLRTRPTVPLQIPSGTWQDYENALRHQRFNAELRRVMAEDSRSREFLNTGIQQVGPVHPVGMEEQDYEPAELRTEYAMVGVRSLRRSVARMMHRVADAIYQEAS